MTALATSTTEKLIEAKPRWSGQIGSGGVADGTVTTIPLQSATNLDNGDIYIATINRVNAQSVKQDTWETFIGELSGTNFINCVRLVEGTATSVTSWAAGTVVEILFTAKHWNNMIDFLGVAHNSDGTMITSLALTTPKITTSINDANGNEVIKTPATASAVNELTVANAATGNAVTLSATGGDTDISLSIKPKGTGVIQVLDGNGNEVIKGGTTASAVNEVTVTNAATGNAPAIAPTGGDTNIDLSLTGKGTGRVTVQGKKRITTITSHATPTINTDNCDAVTITAQAEAITSMTTNLSGTPTNFQPLIIRIKDDGTARAITWGASFASRGATLPTTTTLSKVTMVGLFYNTVTSTWDCHAVTTEA